MKPRIPPKVESHGPCEICGRPAQVGRVDILETYPVRGSDGNLWRTVIPLADPYYRCWEHDPDSYGNRTEWSVFEHDDPFQRRESVRMREKHVFGKGWDFTVGRPPP